MRIRRHHDWDVSPKEAIELQRKLAPLVSTKPPRSFSQKLIAGCDAAFPGGGATKGRTIVAGVVLLRLPAFQVVEQHVVSAQVRYPYIPGLLTFREAPALLKAFERLKRKPDVVVVDGQGRAHPRRLGLACHLGLFLGIPTVGSAKSRLIGEYRQPGKKRGSWSELRDRGELVGRVLRTRDNVKPLFVSVGHRIDLDTACCVILDCGSGYRLPEPQRLAHRLVSRS